LAVIGLVPGVERDRVVEWATEAGRRLEVEPRIGVGGEQQCMRLAERGRVDCTPAASAVGAVEPCAVARIERRHRNAGERRVVRVGDVVEAARKSRAVDQAGHRRAHGADRRAAAAVDRAEHRRGGRVQHRRGILHRDGQRPAAVDSACVAAEEVLRGQAPCPVGHHAAVEGGEQVVRPIGAGRDLGQPEWHGVETGRGTVVEQIVAVEVLAAVVLPHQKYGRVGARDADLQIVGEGVMDAVELDVDVGD
jgi:hypothetical protein